MHKFGGWGTSLKVCRDSIRKWSGDTRILAIVFLVCLFEWIRIEQLRGGCMEHGLSISCWYFPHLIVGMQAILYYFGALLLFCDAPFVDNQQMDVILRAGKRNWFRGKIMYILLASCIYFLWIFAVSVLEFIPYVGFSTEWEDMMNILSLDSAYGGSIRRKIIVEYTPIEATLTQYVICVLLAMFLGLLIFYCNLFKKQNVGVGIALLIVLMGILSEFVDVQAQRVLIYFLPMAWTNIEVFKRTVGGVPLAYAVSVLSIGSVVLIALIMRKSKSYSIECQEEM